MMGEPLTKEDIYTGDFLIEMYGAIESYKDILGIEPTSIVVSENNYNRLKDCNLGDWVDKESMRLKDGTYIIAETKWNGNFMKMGGNKYNPK